MNFFCFRSPTIESITFFFLFFIRWFLFVRFTSVVLVDNNNNKWARSVCVCVFTFFFFFRNHLGTIWWKTWTTLDRLFVCIYTSFKLRVDSSGSCLPETPSSTRHLLTQPLVDATIHCKHSNSEWIEKTRQKTWNSKCLKVRKWITSALLSSLWIWQSESYWILKGLSKVKGHQKGWVTSSPLAKIDGGEGRQKKKNNRNSRGFSPAVNITRAHPSDVRHRSLSLWLDSFVRPCRLCAVNLRHPIKFQLELELLLLLFFIIMIEVFYFILLFLPGMCRGIKKFKRRGIFFCCCQMLFNNNSRPNSTYPIPHMSV